MPRKLTKAERAELERQRGEIRWLMSDKRGRAIVWWLLERAGIHRTSFTESAPTMAFQEGRRDVGLALFDRLMDAEPDAYIRLLREHQPADDTPNSESDDDRDGLDSDARG